MATEVQKKIDEIQYTRRQLETIVNSMNLGISVIDRDFQVVYANKWLREHLQVGGGEHCYESRWQRTEVCVDCPVAQSFNTGEVVTVMREEVIADGTRHAFKITAAPIKKDDAITAVVEVIDDVTQLLRLQREIAESRNYLEKIIDSLNDALLVIDENYNIIRANRAAARVCGCSREELVGEKCYRVSHRSDTPCKPPEHTCPLQTMLETGEPVNVLHTHYTADGEERYVEISAAPLHDETGSIQMIEIMHDITHRIRMEREILQKNQELEKLNTIAVIANQSMSSAKLLNQVLCELVELTRMDIGTVHILEDEVFKLVASRGVSRERAEHIARLNIYDSIAGEVYRTGRSVVVENLSEDRRVGIEAVKNSGIGSFISIPLGTQEELLGVIALGSYSQHVFEEGEIRLLETIASYVATTLKRMEMYEAYRESREEYARLFESALDGILTFDRDYRIQSINRAGVLLLKNSVEDLDAARAELLGGDLRDYITFEELEEFTLAVSELLTGHRSSYRRAMKVITAGGRERYYEYHINPVGSGRKRMLQAIIRDVSEEVRLRAEIEAEREKYRVLVESVPLGVYILQDGVIKFANPALSEISGYPLSEIGMNFIEAVAEESRSLVAEQVRLKLEGRPHLEKYEFKLKRRDGSLRDVEVHPTVITYEGRPAILGSILDITPRKKLEEELMQSFNKLNAAYAELEKLNALRTDFLSNISHELKTPLTSIRGYSELLFDETFGELNEEQKKSLEIVLRSCDRLQSLISDLLDISKIESKQLKLQPEPVNLSTFVQRVVEEHRAGAERKALYVKTDVPENIFIRVDPQRFSQALTNIISNAIKFTQKGGITIKAVVKDDNVHMSISDTGIGIPEEHLPHIFDRFYQSDSSINRCFGGSGLGLAITKSIIEAHGGVIWAESEVEVGTTFNILLPLLEVQEEQSDE